MERYSEVLGLPVICVEDGEKAGVIKEIIFCPHKKSVSAFLLESKGFELKKKVILAEDMLSLGKDALIINNMSSLKDLKKVEGTYGLKDKGEVMGLRVYSKAGVDLGIVKDVLFDYKSCTIDGVEVSDGLIQDIVKGRSVVPLLGKVEFGEEVILVDNEAVEEMMETGGGLRNIIDDRK